MEFSIQILDPTIETGFSSTSKNILIFDTATDYLLLALLAKGKLFRIFSKTGLTHGEMLAPAIKALIDKAQIAPRNIDEIIVSKGPGSFTGLRIGVATAKGMASALHIPIYSCSTLDAQAFQIQEYSLAVLFGRKQQYYLRLYKDGKAISEIHDLSLRNFPLLFKNTEYSNLDMLTVTGTNAERLITELGTTPYEEFSLPVLKLQEIAPWDFSMYNYRLAHPESILEEFSGPSYYRTSEAVLPKGKSTSEQEQSGFLPKELE